MRDLILFLAFVGIMPFIFKRPVVGAMAYAVVSLMNPHRLTFGSAQNFPFAMYLCLATLAAILISREQKKIPMTAPVTVMLLFFIWYTITTIFAQLPFLVLGGADPAGQPWASIQKDRHQVRTIPVSQSSLGALKPDPKSCSAPGCPRAREEYLALRL